MSSTACVLTLTQIAQNFELEPYPGVELQPTLRTILTPGEQIPIRLVDRELQSVQM